MTRARQDAGFTLMEILVALTIFLVGVVSVISLLTAGTSLHQSSQRMGAASDLMEDVVLRARRELADAPRSAETGLPVAPDDRPIPGVDGFFYRWTVVATEVSPPYVLEVAVTWLEGGQLRSLESRRALTRLTSLAREVEGQRRGA